MCVYIYINHTIEKNCNNRIMCHILLLFMTQAQHNACDTASNKWPDYMISSISYYMFYSKSEFKTW